MSEKVDIVREGAHPDHVRKALQGAIAVPIGSRMRRAENKRLGCELNFDERPGGCGAHAIRFFSSEK
jgi:hypothetical protein